MSRKKLAGKKNRLFISAIILYLIMLLISISLANLIRMPLFAYLINIKAIDYQTITDSVSVSAMLIKNEYLIRSDADGKVVLLVKDGERVSTGANVAKIKTLTIDNPVTPEKKIYAAAAGIFCSHIDGLEDVLTPDAVGVLDLSRLGNIKKELSANVNNNSVVENGQSIGKIVDNLRPLLLYLELQQDIPSKLLEVGSTVKLNYQGSWFDAKVVKSESKNQVRVMLLSSSYYPDELIHQRSAEFRFLKQDLKGMLVSSNSLVYRDNVPGLYILEEKRIMWVPVELQGRLKNKIAVSGSKLANGTRYIENPHLVHNGDRL